MHRLLIVLLISFFSFQGMGYAQVIQPPTLQLLHEKYTLDGHSLLALKAELESPSIKSSSAANTKTGSEALNNSIPAPLILPKAWCYEDLAIFCKLEVKLEKTFNLPVKFRIGEVNYAEQREGKPYSPTIY
ncbi:MAG: hypothetical protein AAF502_24705 [Bacteroidota bacterium]